MNVMFGTYVICHSSRHLVTQQTASNKGYEIVSFPTASAPRYTTQTITFCTKCIQYKYLLNKYAHTDMYIYFLALLVWHQEGHPICKKYHPVITMFAYGP